jgi:hypothetical protein
MDNDGDCYFVAANLIINELKEGTLVHGHPTLGVFPYEKYGHAWIELNGSVIDYSNGNSVIMPREEYYRLGKIKTVECLYYDRERARQFMLSHKHYGPWEGPFAVGPVEPLED